MQRSWSAPLVRHGATPWQATMLVGQIRVVPGFTRSLDLFRACEVLSATLDEDGGDAPDEQVETSTTNDRNDRSRAQAKIAVKGDKLDASIVAASSAKVARSPEALARTLGWGVETITRRLPALVRSGALIVARPDRYVRPLPLGPIGRLYAVEAKVRDRQAAVQQARAYSAWTDGYVLVMGPLGQSPLQSLLDEVDIDRGGLVVDGRWLRRPVVRTLDPVRRLWSAEHFVAAVWSSYQPSVAP